MNKIYLLIIFITLSTTSSTYGMFTSDIGLDLRRGRINGMRVRASGSAGTVLAAAGMLATAIVALGEDNPVQVEPRTRRRPALRPRRSAQQYAVPTCTPLPPQAVYIPTNIIVVPPPVVISNGPPIPALAAPVPIIAPQQGPSSTLTTRSFNRLCCCTKYRD